MKVTLTQGMDGAVSLNTWMANLGKSVPFTMPDSTEGQALVKSVTQAADRTLTVELDVAHGGDVAWMATGAAGTVEVSTRPGPELTRYIEWAVGKSLTEGADRG